MKTDSTHEFTKEVVIEFGEEISVFYNSNIFCKENSYLCNVLIKGDYGLDDQLILSNNRIETFAKIPISAICSYHNFYSLLPKFLPVNSMLNIDYVKIGKREKRRKEDFETLDEYNEYLLNKLDAKETDKVKIILIFTKANV